MGSQLFFRLACIVPLAITRLERNVFSLVFSLASLISNYESETTRWAAGRRSLPFLFHGLFFVFPTFSPSKGSRKAVTCPDSPFFYPVSGAAPREFFASLLLRTILPTFNSRFLTLTRSPFPLLSLFSSFSFLRAECADDRYLYVFYCCARQRCENCRLRRGSRRLEIQIGVQFFFFL